MPRPPLDLVVPGVPRPRFPMAISIRRLYETASSGHALADQLRSVLRGRLENELDPAIERILDELESLVPNHPSSSQAIGTSIWRVSVPSYEYADWILVAGSQDEARERGWELTLEYIRRNDGNTDQLDDYGLSGPQDLQVSELGHDFLLDRGKVEG